MFKLFSWNELPRFYVQTPLKMQGYNWEGLSKRDEIHDLYRIYIVFLSRALGGHTYSTVISKST